MKHIRKMNNKYINRQLTINPHFEQLIFDWNRKFYFLLGGYGSGKSYAVAVKILLKLLAEKRTALVVRNVFETHRESCFALFKELVNTLNLSRYVRFCVSPLKMTFENGSVLLFKGMDKPEKLKSIHGVSLVWAEECAELSYAGFKELLGRLRHPTLPLHFILSCNPVDTGNWTFTHFFAGVEHEVLNHETFYANRCLVVGDTFYHHSLAEDNGFLPQDYVRQLDALQEFDPDLYRVGRLGRFGANGVKVLPAFTVAAHEDVMAKVAGCQLFRAGMDFGFCHSYNALVRVAVDTEAHVLYVYWEYYKNHQTDDQTAADLDAFRQNGEQIFADSAEPKTIAYFRQQGFAMTGAKKFPHSRLANIKKMRRFKAIVCSEACVHTVEELRDLTFAKDKNGQLLPDTFNRDPHTLSAIWYALDGYEGADVKPRQGVRGKGARGNC